MPLASIPVPLRLARLQLWPAEKLQSWVPELTLSFKAGIGS